MTAQIALKPKFLPRNGATGIVMRDVHFCTPHAHPYAHVQRIVTRYRKAAWLCCIIYRTATEPSGDYGNKAVLPRSAAPL